MIGQIALWLLFDRNELDHLFAVSVATAFAKMQLVRNNPDLGDWIRGA